MGSTMDPASTRASTSPPPASATPAPASGTPQVTVVHAAVDVAGTHARHGSPGWRAPPATQPPSMRQKPGMSVAAQPDAVQASAVHDRPSSHTDDPAHTPPPHTSPPVHPSPSSQLVCGGALDQPAAFTSGSHTWQPFAGFTVPSRVHTPSITQLS